MVTLTSVGHLCSRETVLYPRKEGPQTRTLYDLHYGLAAFLLRLSNTVEVVVTSVCKTKDTS